MAQDLSLRELRPLIVAPANCTDCATVCALKKVGCARDVAAWLKENAIKVEPEGMQKIGAEAKKCRIAIVQEVEEANEAIGMENIEAEKHNMQVRKLAEKNEIIDGVMLQLMPAVEKLFKTALNGHSGPAIAKAREVAPSIVPAETAVPKTVLKVDAPKAQPVEVEEEAEEPVKPAPAPEPEVMVAQDEDDVYFTPEDRANEAKMALNRDPKVRGISHIAKLHKSKVKEKREQAKRLFSSPPFEGLVCTVVKYLGPDRELVRMAAYYRSSIDDKAAREALKKLKQADLAAPVAR